MSSSIAASATSRLNWLAGHRFGSALSPSSSSRTNPFSSRDPTLTANEKRVFCLALDLLENDSVAITSTVPARDRCVFVTSRWPEPDQFVCRPCDDSLPGCFFGFVSVSGVRQQGQQESLSCSVAFSASILRRRSTDFRTGLSMVPVLLALGSKAHECDKRSTRFVVSAEHALRGHSARFLTTRVKDNEQRTAHGRRHIRRSAKT